MNQQEVEQWIAQNGGAQNVQYSTATQRVPNPAKSPTLPDGSDNPNYDPTAPPTIEVKEQKWVAVDGQGKPTGAELHVKPRPDGTFDVVNQTNPTPNRPQSGQATTPRTEGTPITGGGFDNSQPIVVNRDANGQQVGPARALTTEERAAWEKQRNGGKTDAEVQAETKQKDTTPVSTEYVGTGKNRKKVTTYQSGRKTTEDAPTTATATNVSYEPNGTKVTTYDDGTTTREAKAPTAGTVVKGAGPNGEDMQAVTGPDGKVSYQSITGSQIPAANQTIPRGAPKFTPDANDPAGDYGVAAYNEQLLEANRNGILTREQGRQLLEQAGSSANIAKSRDDAAATRAQTTRGQDITQRGQDIGEVQSRRAAADTGYDNATTAFIGNAAHLGRGNGGLAADAFREALGLRQTYAQQAGGYTDVPQTPISPMVQSVRTTTVHPDGTVVHAQPVAQPAATPTPAPTAPSAAASGPPVFSPTVGNNPSYGPASAQSVAAPAAASPAPDMRNSSDMNLPPGTPTAPEAANYAPGAGTIPLPQGTDLSTPGTDVPFNDPANPTPGLPVGMVPSYLGRNTTPTWDPSPVVADLKARGFSDAAINQALQEHLQEQGAVAA